jgi:transposase
MVAVMREPREIEDEEYEQVLERVAAVDVAKASGMVCTRVPHESRPGRRRTRVRGWMPPLTRSWSWRGSWRARGSRRSILEATSDYWRIWFYLLESAGLDVQLASAGDVKNAPGRPKTDKLDAVWLAKLTERGCCGPASSRRRGSGGCGTTPGCGWT